MDFIVCTEDLNRYGYRVLLNGLKLDNFKKNPVMLYDHNKWGKPIGRWENLRIEDGKLIATAKFAKGIDEAEQVQKLVEQDILSATSVGFKIISTSTDPEVLLQGQQRATVTEAELWEISITSIPANANTVKLSTDTDKGEYLPELLHLKETEMSFEKTALSLGLNADATEQQIIDAIAELKADNAKSVIELGVQRGVITEDNKATYEKLVAADLSSVRELILSEKPVTPEDDDEEDDTFLKNKKGNPTLSAFLKQQGGGGNPKNEKDNWDYEKWSIEDPEGLNEIRLNDPEKYKALADAYANS